MARRLLSGLVIAAYALRWKGQGYVYGAPSPNSPGKRPGNWDCSSFESYVLHGVGLPIPSPGWGGPTDHGPVVLDYVAWQGAVTVQTPQRGDLVCFAGSGPNGHIGIVLGPNQMISALNETVGTVVTPIDGYGPAGAPIIYRRVTGTVTKAPPGVPGRQVSAPSTAEKVLEAVAVVAVVGVVAGVATAVVVTVAPALIGGILAVRRLTG